MGKVHLIQYLCERDHCFVAAAFQPAEELGEKVEAQILQAVRSRGAPYCGICGSRRFHFRESPTGWRSLEEAWPHLRQGEAEQIAARQVMDALGLTIEPWRGPSE